jgi:hypothetical protein
MINIAFDTTNNRHPKSVSVAKGVFVEYDEKYTQSRSINFNQSSLGNKNVILILTRDEVSPNIKSADDIKVFFPLAGYSYSVTYSENRDEYWIGISRADGSSLLTTATIKFRANTTIAGDYVTYSDDDAIFNITNLGGQNKVFIQIDNWNTPNSPLVITGIYADISIDINSRNLISLERTIQDRSDFKLPSYGIISNTGNLEFNDLDGEVRDYAEMLLLNSGAKCTIYLNNTLVNKHQVVGTFETNDWDYDNDNRSVSVSLKDDLEEWQDIYVEGFGYDPRNPFNVLKNGTMEDLYRWLSYATPAKYSMPFFYQLDTQTQEILKNTKIIYPLLEASTLWQQWNKLCQVCGLYIYKNGKGNIVCSYIYGS